MGAIIDAHVHFWDPAVLRYPWLDAHRDLQRRYVPDDYESFATGAIDAVVFVEANCEPTQNLEEVAFVERLASSEARIAGAVAFVDLQDERRTAESLERLKGSALVVGVRQNIQGHPAGFALTAAFARGVQEAARRGLPFDLCLTADQLPEVTELVERSQETQFVLDHCAKPAIGENALEPWARDLSKLAEHANVVCKVSGLLTEMRLEQDIDDDLAPYLDHVLSCFGPERLLFGSDWPVVTLRAGEPMWRARMDRFTASWSRDERHQFYAGTARRVYGLRV